ncbi:MAG TPA: outer membrane protein assembly factor BamD [Holophaga sp.]|jgi:outer membrane protein assembly factor BamD|nr:outer membrane protein assembly factor BamD [Holophaga sp.]
MKQRSTLILPLAALMVLGGTAACRKKISATPTKKEEGGLVGRTATDIVEEAELRLQRKQWTDARTLLRVVEENLPSSKEYPRAKLLLGDSYFFSTVPSFPEAVVEYQSFLTYFPKHEQKPYALYQIALCHYATIETAERDQSETRKAIDAFQKLINEAPGSIYAVDAKAKLNQCWHRLAESELQVGIFYVKTYPASNAGYKRIKNAMEAYPDFVDRERAYFFLGEAMRSHRMEMSQLEQFGKDYLARVKKDNMNNLTRDEYITYSKELNAFITEEFHKSRQESRDYYQKLVESYPNSEWVGKAKDRLVELGQSIKEELDS